LQEPTSRRPNILVKQSTETIATLDTYLALLDRRCNRRTCRMGWVEAQRSVRPVTIVMCDEDGQDSPEMLFVQDQQPVKTLGPNGAYETLRHAVRLRGAKRRPDNLASGAAKHLSVNFWSRSRIT